MGCNCGGSGNVTASGATVGPGSPGYTWTGPAKRAEQSSAQKSSGSGTRKKAAAKRPTKRASK